MSDNVDFDALARKTADSNGTMGDLNNLWGAAFALSEWHFIARGELPNVRPYIASNAEYADGKQMIRAFTDTERLQRFAKENNLTSGDGSTQILSLPTAKLVDYLEQFIQYGVHGIWFNSDRESDGFFLPLAQLRPVKEYLAKMNWQPPIEEPAPPPESSKASSAAAVWESSAPVSDAPPTVAPVETAPPVAPTAQTRSERIETLVVTVQDGLALPSGFISKASYACNFFCRVPESWIEGETLKSDYLEKIYAQVYGPSWRMGNDDGSRYVVLDSSVKIFTPDEVKNATWSEIENTKENNFWFYIVDAAGEIRNVKAQEFQAEIDAAPTAGTQTAAPEPPLQSPAFEDSVSALSGAASGSEHDYFRTGEVSFDTTLSTFETKLASLLQFYQGSGEFGELLPLERSKMEGLVENTLSNDYGTYLRSRRFYYELTPGALSSVSALDSNALRQPEMGVELRVNFVLLKNLAAQSGVLRFSFDGAEAAIINMLNGLEPLLDACGFKETS